MAKLNKLELREIPQVRVIGREIHKEMTGPNPIPQLWQTMMQNHDFATLMKLPLAFSDFTVGWMGEVSATGFTYIAGVFAEPNTEVPTGMQFRDLQATAVVESLIEGNLANGEVYMRAHDLTETAMKEKDLIPSSEAGWEAEVYPGNLTYTQEEGMIGYFIPYQKVK